MSIIRGTTPTLGFNLTIDPSILDTYVVTLKQNTPARVIQIDKKESDCIIDGMKIMVPLTQEDTLKLNAGYPTKVQLKAKKVGGAVIATRIFEVPTDEILEDGVI